MRNPPPMSTDPYRTLGLEPGASMAEVKRAYRRLAKAFHPDSAGEAALPRFLAIHEAYEHIKTGRPAPSLRVARETPAAEPWRADPARARAARERARAGRTRPAGAGTSTTSSGASPGAGATGSSGPTGSSGARASRGAAGSSGATGAPGATGSTGAAGPSGSGASAGARPAGPRSSGRRRDVRKATLGSTSYDEARDPADPTWSGASWYGPTTGEYWIVNPREYADPRKHGPDYQSRSRRLAGDDAPDPAADPAEPRATNAGYGSETRGWTRPTNDAGWPSTGRAAGVAGTAGAAGTAAAAGAAGSAGTAAAAGAAGMPRRDPGDVRFEAPAPGLPLRLSRDWLGGSADDPIRRLGVALVAWPPIGLAAAAAIGELTGCATFSAECGSSDAMLPWLAQAAILGLLLLLPPLARLMAGGAVAVVLALVPITSFLLVIGGGGEPEAGLALGTLLGLAWLAGVAWAAVVSRRRRAATSGP